MKDFILRTDGNGRSFNEFLRLKPDLREASLGWLCPVLTEAESRQRRRRPDDEANYRQVVSLVLANVISLLPRRPGAVFHVSRRTGTYSRVGPYHPAFLGSQTLRTVLDSLERLGFVVQTKGRPDLDFGRGSRTTIGLTPEFRAVLEERGFGPDSIELDRLNAPALIFKDGDKRRITYDTQAPRIADMIATVRRCNAFLERHQIEPETNDDRWGAMLRRKEDDGEQLPDLLTSRLYRVFSNASWDQCGRWYGGWWQNVPSDVRDLIRINGQATIERDFTGFLPRAAYHSLGLEFEGDPYAIPEIREAAERQGADWNGRARKGVKKMMNVLLNGSPGDRPETMTGYDFPRGITRTRGRQLIEDRHQPLGDRFLQGWGIELMKVESDICEQVLLEGIDNQIVVLPIHDSFIVQARHAPWLEAAMTTAYRDRLGFAPLLH